MITLTIVEKYVEIVKIPHKIIGVFQHKFWEVVFFRFKSCYLSGIILSVYQVGFLLSRQFWYFLYDDGWKSYNRSVLTWFFGWFSTFKDVFYTFNVENCVEIVKKALETAVSWKSEKCERFGWKVVGVWWEKKLSTF